MEAGADIKARESIHGWTVLTVAAILNENPEVISTLLEAGADIEARDSFFGRTPLMWAAMSNQNPEAITTLLKAGAKAKDKAGKTAFDDARYNE
jgi:ankyrin repeat protein